MSISHAAAFRRRAGAGTIIAFFCVLLASTLIEPTDSHSNGDQLRAAAAHSGAMQAASWCEILAGVLAPVVVLTLMHIVRGRGVVLAHVGGILGILGSASGALIGLHGLFVVALAGRGDATAVLDRLDHIAPAITVLFFALPVALAMLAIAAVRGGLAPRWVIPAAVLFVLADFARAGGGNRPDGARPGRVRPHRQDHLRHERRRVGVGLSGWRAIFRPARRGASRLTPPGAAWASPVDRACLRRLSVAGADTARWSARVEPLRPWLR